MSGLNRLDVMTPGHEDRIDVRRNWAATAASTTWVPTWT